MKVLKFGGSSVANAVNIQKVIHILEKEAKKEKIAVVFSAVGGITDKLILAGELATKKDSKYKEVFKEIVIIHRNIITHLCNDIEEVKTKTTNYLQDLELLLKGVYLINEFSDKTKAKVLSFGEVLSTTIILAALSKTATKSILKNSRELIKTDSTYIQAKVNFETTNKNIQSFFKENNYDISIFGGFISSNSNGEPTTLGRGGSDYTAAIIAAALNVKNLEIWTDVSGMYTANPRLVKHAFPIAHISYQEAMELSHFGAKVLYPPTVLPALKKEITIIIKNTFEPENCGTVISKEVPKNNKTIKGISHIENVSLLTLEGNGMVGVPGFSMRLFAALSQKNINIILITQASSEHSICLGVNSEDEFLAKKVIDKEFVYEISLKKIKPISIENNLAVIAVVGDNMKNHLGVSGKIFNVLGENKINVRAIAQGASERNISIVIADKDIKKALNTLHNRFFEKQIKQLRVYLVGVGNVGATLLEQISQQQKTLKNKLLLDIQVVGISNSTNMCFDKNGIDLSNWKELIKRGIDQTPESFLQQVKSDNLNNSVYIDVTANHSITKLYPYYIKENISVIACNKIACSSSYESYQNLKKLSKENNTPFLFETNVGAGLPILNTLKNLIDTGDTITSIEAVLSGSLNFICNNFDKNNSFYNVVQQAQKEGYTEPDPRIDLSGVDVARKILILARESGFQMELEDIENVSFLAKDSLKTDSVDAFFATLKTDVLHYNALYANATKNNCKLKYVASFKAGKAKVELREVPRNHPFYNLEGKDNIVLFYTDRYKEQPLIIKGAGAGAEVTASGLFADIISIGKN